MSSSTVVYGSTRPAMQPYLVILRDPEDLDRATGRADLIQANITATQVFQQKLEALIKARNMEKQLGRIQVMGTIRGLTVLATPAIADILKMLPEVDTVTDEIPDAKVLATR
jgi:hypothetical protein